MVEFETLRSELTDKFQTVEVQYNQFKRKQGFYIFGLIVLCLLSFGLAATLTQNPLFGAFGAVAFIMLFLAIRNHQKKKIANLFKSSILIPAIQKGFPELKYRSNPGVHKSDFLASTLYTSAQVDRYTSEDLFEGRHGETDFRFSEVHAERRETRSNGNGGTSTHYVTVFRGIFMVADFNKSLSHTTRVIQAKDGFFEKLFNRNTKVSLENPIFEKIFNTYSQDQVEARYILSTAMMERIVKLQKMWNDKVNLSFSGNHVYIAINHARNLFEPDLSEKMELEQVERIFKEIQACLKIIDTLDLNTRIWTKN